MNETHPVEHESSSQVASLRAIREVPAIATLADRLARARNDFPIFEPKPGEAPLIYLDNAATTQKPRAVIEAMTRFYERSNASVHRGAYRLSDQATDAYEKSREVVASFFGAASARSIVFTRGTTESINLVAQAWLAPRLRPGDQVLLTDLEHHSNIVPWQLVTQKTGAELVCWPVTSEGCLDMAEAERWIGPRTRLIAITAVSNVLGTINPLSQVIALARQRGVPVLVDGAQAAARIPLNLHQLGCDFFVCSAHKMYGPTGIGVLYGTTERLQEMEPWMTGGGMVQEVHSDHATWTEHPWKFEAGTPPIAEAVGFGAAIDYLDNLGLARIQEHESLLVRRAIDVLKACGGIELYGPRSTHEPAGILSFNVAGIHPHDIARALDEEGIALRAGQHCAQPLMRKLGLSGTVRLSVGIYNTTDEIDLLAGAIERARSIFSE